MNLYVIQREDGAFVGHVNKTGGASYTNKITHARAFYSEREAKEYGVCGNERVVNVEDLLTVGTEQEFKR